MKITAYRSRDSYAQVNWEMVKEVGGDITLAVVFDWITWKADPAYDGIEDNEGVVWYSATVSALAATMNVTDKVVRRALDELVKRGHLAVAELRLTGPYDRTKSYRPLWDDETISAPEASAPPAPDDHETAALEGDSTCPTGQLPFALQGSSELPCGANAPLYETSTEVKDKNSLSAAELDIPGSIPTFQDHFEAFWSAYPRHEGKAPARIKFVAAAKKLLPAELVAHAIAYRDNPNRTRDLKHVPHASTWLNQERWADEIPEQAAAPPGAPSAFDHNSTLVDYFRRKETDHGPDTDSRNLAIGR